MPIMAPERKIHHEYFSAPHDLLKKHPDSWFYQYGLTAPGAIFSSPDIRFSRLLVANMLTEAWDRNRFFAENDHLIPKPEETDRMLLIAWLQQIASFVGLLNGEEIREIQECEGSIPSNKFILKEPDLLSFEQIAKQAGDWKSQKSTIGLFHGSFDPPTVAHLGCATEAYLQCDRLLIAFDNDDLLRKRKGNDRPRFPLIDRRKIFGSFWMVDATLILRAKEISDVEQFAQDYRELGIDYVFLASNQEDHQNRLEKIAKGGAEPKYLKHRGNEFSSTRMLERAIQWGFVSE
jgi:glycerol-3-phosphate cytidylyltransferase-like family protein